MHLPDQRRSKATLVHIVAATDSAGAEGSARRIIRLDRRLSVVGSKRGSHIRIASRDISGSHALLLNLHNQIQIRDLMSRTGIFVNEEPVSDATLRHGDVVRFGKYRFRFDHPGAASTTSLSMVPRGVLTVQGQPNQITISHSMFVIGSREGVDLVLQGEGVSQSHAVIFDGDARWMIRDLNSRHGISINGVRCDRSVLGHGDVIGIGPWAIEFSFSAMSRAKAFGDNEESSPPENSAILKMPAEDVIDDDATDTAPEHLLFDIGEELPGPETANDPAELSDSIPGENELTVARELVSSAEVSSSPEEELIEVPNSTGLPPPMEFAELLAPEVLPMFPDTPATEPRESDLVVLPQRRRRRLLMALGLVVLAVVLGILAIIGWRYAHRG